MRAAFFHDHRFGRDPSGTYYSNGALPYQAFARYLRHFDELVVVARAQPVTDSMRTVASGAGVEMACLERTPRELYLGNVLARHAREVMARVDCAILRLPSLFGRVGCREAIRAGKPWMVEVVGCPWQALWGHGSLRAKALAVPSYLRTRHYVRRAPFALYVSNEFLQRRYPCRGQTVACSNVAIERPRRSVLEARLARLGSPPRGALALGLVGSLDVDYKGHDTALRSIALLRDSFPDVRLRFLGGGDPSRWRRRAAKLGVERLVEFSGVAPHGAPVLDWMDGLDLFLVPSLTEGLPRALIEAMSRALPAVGSRTGGIPELLPGDCVHEPRDHRRLAQLIARLLRSPDEMKVHAQRNWEIAGDYAMDVLEERRDRFLGAFEAFAAASCRERARPVLGSAGRSGA